jgi:hypothetical protein
MENLQLFKIGMGQQCDSPKLKKNRFNYRITETKLAVDANVVKAITVELCPRKYAKVISGECMLDLSENESVRWDINQQFSFIHCFIKDFIPDFRGQAKRR